MHKTVQGLGETKVWFVFVLPANCESPSRLVGMLLCVLWVFLRWRVCRATMAGSWLLRQKHKVSNSNKSNN